MVGDNLLGAWIATAICAGVMLSCGNSRASAEPDPALPGGAGGEAGSGGTFGAEPRSWVGTWATSPQLTEPTNLPPAPGLSGNTLRQIVYASIGGSELRLQFSNAFGTSPVMLNAVHVALPTTGSSIEPASDVALTFDGMPSATIPAGAEVFSDSVEFELSPQTKVAVTIHFGAMSNDIVTGHPGSRTTSYLQSGNAVDAPTFSAASMTDHWYVLSAIDVMAPQSSRAIVTLGDSITDGRGSTTNGNDRWPDVLSRRLRASPATAGVAVLNMGVGGNTVLAGGLGPTALQRFDRDVLAQRGARWLIVLEGVNDIGNSGGPQVATDLIAAYQRFIDGAHGQGMLVYGVPILPFGGAAYDSVAHETARQTVNDWIRSSGRFDAVIELDAVVRDPSNPTRLLAAYDTGDHLHLNAAGLQAMADAIDLALFAGD
jgi:lysophospholipase L1-like esterase